MTDTDQAATEARAALTAEQLEAIEGGMECAVRTYIRLRYPELTGAGPAQAARPVK
jgi:hypothetical protein